MRDPRLGIPWSLGRVQRRVSYAAWMASPAWQRRREAWRKAWIATHGQEPACQICGSPWSLRSGDLHHRSYQRLGHETDADLIPLCRTPCHQELHHILESNPAWLKTAGRTHATDMIVARLRAKTHQGEPHG